jgi:hypothetical protein
VGFFGSFEDRLRNRQTFGRMCKWVLSGSTKTIYLPSCVAQKAETCRPAEELYISDWFRNARSYVTARMGPRDRWYILSAKHHLVEPRREICPYNETLKAALLLSAHGGPRTPSTGVNTERVAERNCSDVMRARENSSASPFLPSPVKTTASGKGTQLTGKVLGAAMMMCTGTGSKKPGAPGRVEASLRAT